MNVSNLRRNMGKIVSENYVIKSLKWDHRIIKNYVSNKWDKENVMIMFRSYLRIITGSYGSLTLDSYIIKPCKWNQKMAL